MISSYNFFFIYFSNLRIEIVYKEKMTWTSPWSVVKTTGPKLVPFFKSTAIFFVLFPYNSSETLICLITKCLPIAFLCLFVIMHGFNLKFEYSYSRRIFLGLVFSMIGDACLVYPKE